MARQMVVHGHVLVNERRNTIPKAVNNIDLLFLPELESVLADAAASTLTSVLTRLSVKSSLECGATGSKDVNPEPPRELVFRSAT